MYEDGMAWNEANTFTKLIYQNLTKELGYPDRGSEYVDEQTWVRKRNGQSGPYDCVVFSANGLVLLIEAKKENKNLTCADIKQAQDYALSTDFGCWPPPFILVSNGKEFIWLSRKFNKCGEPYYEKCNPKSYADACKSKAGKLPTDQISLKQLISLLIRTRIMIFDDLEDIYFSGDQIQVEKIEAIKRIRKSYSYAEAPKINQIIISSISASISLKILFIKLLSDIEGNNFTKKIKSEILKKKSEYPGILCAEPYDALTISDECEKKIAILYRSISIGNAVYFTKSKNILGEIWDGLVQSEQDIFQVDALGNVYTPNAIVESMVDKADKIFQGDWRNKKILEPCCGSGHFVREIYLKVFDSICKATHTRNKAKILRFHQEALRQIRSIDIDPFAIQVSQLGFFLEFSKSTDIWNAIYRDATDKVDFDLKLLVFNKNFFELDLQEFMPDLIIGNPPYGVKVAAELQKEYGLNSSDSYGCFIKKSLEMLSNSGHLLFITSSTFLTIQSHRNLREFICKNSKILSIFLLHRQAFSKGRTVFPALIHLQKECNPAEIETNIYQFWDAWPLHPTNDEQNSVIFEQALSSWKKGNVNHAIEENLLKVYLIKQKLITYRTEPPDQNYIDSVTSLNKKNKISYSIGFNDGWTLKTIEMDLNGNLIKSVETPCQCTYPIISGSPLFFSLCNDKIFRPKKALWNDCYFPTYGNIKSMQVDFNSKKIDVIKLWQIARIPVGLQTSDNKRFIRKSEIVTPNGVRADILNVNPKCCLTPSELDALTDKEKKEGIDVDDFDNQRYFIPYDKGGESDPKNSILRKFWSPVDYWIDWSQTSVQLLIERSNLTGSGKAYIRNPQFYFKKGISYAMSGIYSPTFEMGFGGVFDQKSPLIIPYKEDILKYLLGYLNYPLVRYLAKTAIQHTIDTTPDATQQIPVIVPDQNLFDAVTNKVDAILLEKQKNNPTDNLEKDLNTLFDDFLGISFSTSDEWNTWFKRRYPRYGRNHSHI